MHKITTNFSYPGQYHGVCLKHLRDVNVLATQRAAFRILFCREAYHLVLLCSARLSMSWCGVGEVVYAVLGILRVCKNWKEQQHAQKMVEFLGKANLCMACRNSCLDKQRMDPR